MFPYGDRGNVIGEHMQLETYRFDEKKFLFLSNKATKESAFAVSCFDKV